jgi:hypothetical protein
MKLNGLLTYPGLITDPNVWNEAKKRIVGSASSQNGQRSRDKGTGMYGMTDGQKRLARSKGAHTLIQNQSGIHALTTEDRHKVGLDNKLLKRGIFNMSREERALVGKNSGQKSYENKLGIHAQTPEQHKEIGKMAAIKKGQIPFSDEEITLIHQLSADPEYK